MASEYDLIAEILDNRYKEDVQTNPYFMGAQGMGPAPTEYSGNWWEALAQGLAYGGSKGFMTRMGVNDVKKEKAQNMADALEYAKLREASKDNPEALADFEKKGSPLVKELATKMKLLSEVKKMEAESDTKFGSQPMPEDEVKGMLATKTWLTDEDREKLLPQMVGKPRYIVTQQMGDLTKAMTMSPEMQEARSSASAEGRLTGGGKYNMSIGLLPDKLETKIAAAKKSLEGNLVAKNYQLANGFTEDLEKLLEKDNPIADYMTAVKSTKLIDPGTASREGEVAALLATQTKFQALQSFFNKELAGKSKMTDKQKSDLKSIISDFKKTAADQYYNTVLRPAVGGLASSPMALASFEPPAGIPSMYEGDYDKIRKAGRAARDAWELGQDADDQSQRASLEEML